MSSVVKVKKIKEEKKDETKIIDIEAEPEKVIKKVKKIKEPILDTPSVEKEKEPEKEVETEIEQEPEKPKKPKKVKEVKDKEIILEDGEKGGYDATEKGTEEEVKTKGKIKKTKETGKKEGKESKDKVIKEEIAESNEIYKGLQVLIVESPNKSKK